MRACVVHSKDVDSVDAVAELIAGAQVALGASLPRVGMLFAGIDHDFAVVLEQIDALAPANQLLGTSFCQQLNHKFAVAPRSTADYHRSAKGYDLAAIFCIQEERTASADWIVRFENEFYQLSPRRKSQVPRRSRCDRELRCISRRKQTHY